MHTLQVTHQHRTVACCPFRKRMTSRACASTSSIARSTGDTLMPRRSTTSPRGARPTSNDDAVSMLMDDHKEVQKLFREFETAHDNQDEDACRDIAEHICSELEIHTTLEEELFYPAAREALGEDEELIDEAEIEHQSAKDLISEIRAMDGS